MHERCSNLFTDESSSGPVTVNKPPRAINQNNIPRVLSILTLEMHPRLVVDTFSVSVDRLTAQTDIAELSHIMCTFISTFLLRVLQNCHLIVVGEFVWFENPESHTGWGLLRLTG